MAVPAVLGITPAYAGNTYLSYGRCVQDKDHPRLRGEHKFMPALLPLMVGSPPPTRGTHDDTLPFSGVDRITPAYAGNTLTGCP